MVDPGERDPRALGAGTPLANFYAVWGSVLIVLFNINRIAQKGFTMNPFAYFGIFWLLPFVITIIVGKYLKHRKRLKYEEEKLSKDFLEELEEGGEVG